MKTRIILIFCAVLAVLLGSYSVATQVNLNTKHQIGDVVDELNGVKVYYNGAVGHVLKRNTTKDGYNLGLQYQCVEFVKRYYYEHFNHKMPDSYGHAKDFFDAKIADGQLNPKRNLIQYKNGNATLPQVDDLLVFDGNLVNPYGHVAIISKVDTSTNEIEIIQQNPGPFSPSRQTFALVREGKVWKINSKLVLGWLRLRN